MQTQFSKMSAEFETEWNVYKAREAAEIAREKLSLAERLVQPSEEREINNELTEATTDKSNYWDKRWQQIKEEGGS